MANNSKIEWTDASWNPVVGCSKVSEGCRHCYAMGVAHRNAAMGIEQYKGLTLKKVSGVEWNGKVRLVSDALDKPLHWKQSKMIFVNSMSDLFHEDVPFEFIDKVFLVMASCPQHIFQILTKRADRLLEYYTSHYAKHYSKIIESTNGFPLRNVWIGVSVENQKNADERIPKLLKIQAAVRWLSCEPLLGEINFTKFLFQETYDDYSGGREGVQIDKIDWVVVGGESGPRARKMNPEWVVSLLSQCRIADAAFFFKQWGGKNKKKSGRLLDGREWNEYPFGTSADIRSLKTEIQESFVKNNIRA